MEVYLENILIYGLVIIFCIVIVIVYLRKQKRESKRVQEKIITAKREGLYEPVSLHPIVDQGSCIKTGACISACPEKDILGIVNGKATTINASQCIGHGACFHACPTDAISLCIGTEKRGVDLPHIDKTFETNIPGIFIAGELGGMGLIKNAVEQGRQAVENIVKSSKKEHLAEFDLIIVGAGPAGISASLEAKKHGLRTTTFEQDTLGGTVFSFPRSKIVMTSPMNLPLYGKVKLFETSKSELIELWQNVLQNNNINIVENKKVENISLESGHFKIKTLDEMEYTSRNVLLSIGRRGSPRKLNIPGEELEKVAYRLLEPELVAGQNIMIVGGGDSAIEAALLLAEQNKVTLSYRKDVFSRIKPKNSEKIKEAIENKLIDVRFNTELVEIKKEGVIVKENKTEEIVSIQNELVYIFAGGELPTKFLEKIGLKITTKFGEAILKH